jgi:hypothetical protein
MKDETCAKNFLPLQDLMLSCQVNTIKLSDMSRYNGFPTFWKLSLFPSSGIDTVSSTAYHFNPWRWGQFLKCGKSIPPFWHSWLPEKSSLLFLLSHTNSMRKYRNCGKKLVWKFWWAYISSTFLNKNKWFLKCLLLIYLSVCLSVCIHTHWYHPNCWMDFIHTGHLRVLYSRKS